LNYRHFALIHRIKKLELFSCSRLGLSNLRAIGAGAGKFLGVWRNFARISPKCPEKFLCAKPYKCFSQKSSSCLHSTKQRMYRSARHKTKLQNCCWCSLQKRSSIYLIGRQCFEEERQMQAEFIIQSHLLKHLFPNFRNLPRFR